MTFDKPLDLCVRDEISTLEDNAMSRGEPVSFVRASRHFENLDLEIDREARTCWCYMRPADRPSFTHPLLNDIGEMQSVVKAMFAAAPRSGPTPFDYFVFGSRLPGVYNLGGDLSLFAERIRAQDEAAMRHYGYAAVELIHQNVHAFQLPVITMALVQGDALGGGLECALSYDLIVAERSAKMGLPEILFNLFPGMGAYSFVSRKLGPALTEKMILSGNIYTAAELHALGVVDVLAEDGQGEDAARDYISRNARKHNAHRALYETRRRVNPLSLQELRDVIDIWVDAALRLTEPDLRKMTRLAAAQDKRFAAIGALPRSAAA